MFFMLYYRRYIAVFACGSASVKASFFFRFYQAFVPIPPSFVPQRKTELSEFRQPFTNTIIHYFLKKKSGFTDFSINFLKLFYAGKEVLVPRRIPCLPETTFWAGNKANFLNKPPLRKSFPQRGVCRRQAPRSSLPFSS